MSKTRLEVLRENATHVRSKKYKGWLLDAVERAEKAEAQLEQIEKICTDANRTKTDTGLRNIIAQIWHITQARLEKSDENKT